MSVTSKLRWLRPVSLVAVMFLLLAFLIVQTQRQQEDQREQLFVSEEVKQELLESKVNDLGYYDPEKRAAKPLSFPDYGDGPYYHMFDEPKDVLGDWLTQAEYAENEAFVLKTQKAGTGLNRVSRISTVGVGPDFEEFQERYTQFRLRELEAYERLTTDTGDVKAAGVAFLKTYLDSTANFETFRDHDQCVELASQVIELESTDPLLMTYVAYTMYAESGDWQAAQTVWTQCVEQLRESEYPKITTVYLRLFADDVCKFLGSGAKHALIVSIVQWLEQEAQDDQWADCVHVKLDSILRSHYESFGSELLVACSKSERIDPFIMHWLAGSYWHKQGWKARGGAWASATSQAQFDEFHAHLNKAKLHLECAYVLRPDSPYPPLKMMSVAMGGADDMYEPFDWFLRLTESRFDYWAGYQAIMTPMLPRWGGSEKEFYQFAQACLRTDRFDTHVPYFVFDVLAGVRRRLHDGESNRLEAFGANELIDEFFKHRASYRAAHPDEALFGDTPYQRARIGLMLEDLDRHSDAYREYTSGDGELDWAVLQKEKRPGKYLFHRLAACQGEMRQRVLRFDRQLRRAWPADSQPAALEPLQQEWAELSATAADENAKLYYAHTERMLEHLKAYFADEWVDLSFENEGLGWEVAAGTVDWSQADENRMLGRERGVVDIAWAEPLVRFAPPFHLEADMRTDPTFATTGEIGVSWQDDVFIPTSTQQKELFLYNGFQSEWRYPTLRKQVDFYESSDFDERFFAFKSTANMEKTETVAANPEPLSSPSFDWKLHHQASEVRLGNHTTVVRYERPVSSKSRLSFVVKFRQPSKSSPCHSEFVWELGQVRIRRIDLPPLPPPTADSKQRLEYWQQRAEMDEHDPLPKMQILQLNREQMSPQEIVDLANQAIESVPGLDEAHIARGMNAYELKNYRQALESLELVTHWFHYRDSRLMMIYGELKACVNDESLRDGEVAVDHAYFGKRGHEQAGVEITSRHWAILAAAYAEDGRFEDALTANQEAINLADEDEKVELLERQQLYENKTPYRYPLED